MAELSPMMQQYLEIKKQHKDEILFYRIGDFYEMFFDDALTASKELDLTLTGKQCGMEERAPMCGVPFHSYEGYVARLNYLGVPGLKIGGSFYYCHNTGANSDKPETYVKYGNIPLRIYTADLQYKNKYVTARANMIYGNLSKADDLSSVNNHQSGGSPYTQTTPIAKPACGL